jgi:branched-chain amino acid transport system permease protein
MNVDHWAIRSLGWVALLVVAIGGPSLVDTPYARSLLVLIGIYALLAISYDIIVGFAGVISFGHAGFFALGAYTLGLGTTRYGWSLVFCVAVAAVLGVLVSFVLGAISLRISGHYFAVSTLAFAEIFRLCLQNFDGLTRGPLGLLIPPGSIELVPGFVLEGDYQFHLLIWLSVVAAVYLVVRIKRSWLGWSFLALRENSELASSVGIFPLKIRLTAIAMSGALGTVAGVYYGAYYGVLTPEVSGAKYSVIVLVIVMLGGRGTVAGPLVGASVYVFLPELLGLQGAKNEVVFGLILIATLLVMPKGLTSVGPKLLDVVAAFASRRKGPDGPTGGVGQDSREPAFARAEGRGGR